MEFQMTSSGRSKMTRGNEPVGVHRVEVKKRRLNPWWIVWNAMVGTMSLAALALVGWSAGFIAIVTCMALSASILMVAMHAYYNSGEKYLEE
jgi:hypothetical protein